MKYESPEKSKITSKPHELMAPKVRGLPKIKMPKKASKRGK